MRGVDSDITGPMQGLKKGDFWRAQSIRRQRRTTNLISERPHASSLPCHSCVPYPRPSVLTLGSASSIRRT